MKEWKNLSCSECGVCGGSIEIYTDVSMPENWGYDGDEVRCVEPDCKAIGSWCVSGFDDESAYVDFDI